MAKAIGKAQCVNCGKEKSAVICAGCLQVFCFNHLNDHRQELSQQFDEIENNRDLFRQTLNEQINNPLKHSLIKQIDKWEFDSIELIQKTAKKCKDQILLQLTDKHFDRIEINLTKFTNELREIRQENDLNNFKEKLTELEEIPNVFIQHIIY
jgi:F0F1-type ATP synthase gamma subunit